MYLLIRVFYLKSTIFWAIMPCSPLKVNRRFGRTFCLHLQGRRISRKTNQRESRWQAEFYPPTLKMEAICSSETSVDFQRITRRYIPEDSTFHNHRCENLKSYISFYLTTCRSTPLYEFDLVHMNSHFERRELARRVVKFPRPLPTFKR
jgi:hypothetical protein